MSEADIERMLEVAERFAEDDRRVRETLEWRNGLETYVYNVKDKMNEEEVCLYSYLYPSCLHPSFYCSLFSIVVFSKDILSRQTT
tara:strand:- start:3056 stop:3310 length:255 start_codon:yes stop_codon:yes gene_type:complete